MSREQVINENKSLGLNYISLDKIVREYNLPKIPFDVQIYLSGVIDRVNSPKKQEEFSAFVVQSKGELESVISKTRNDSQPNVLPNIVAQLSGDFWLNYNAQLYNLSEIEFPSICYSVAQFYSNKMGKNSTSEVFGKLSLNLKSPMVLLANYYNHLRTHPEFSISDEDYLSFKKKLMDKDKQDLVIPQKIDTNLSDEILI